MQGSPGELPRLVSLLGTSWPVLLAVGASGYLLRAVYPVPYLSLPAVGIAFVVLGLGLAVALVFMRLRFAAFLKGAQGEEQVAHELGFLPGAYSVFHGVALRGAVRLPARDFDHVVVGPTGVFVIETKNWDGTVTIANGSILCDERPPSRPPLEQVRQAASRLRAALEKAGGWEVPVRPVICFAGEGFAGDCRGVGGVLVCSTHGLNRALLDPPDEPLAQETQAAIGGFLEKCMD